MVRRRTDVRVWRWLHAAICLLKPGENLPDFISQNLLFMALMRSSEGSQPASDVSHVSGTFVIEFLCLCLTGKGRVTNMNNSSESKQRCRRLTCGPGGQVRPDVPLASGVYRRHKNTKSNITVHDNSRANQRFTDGIPTQDFSNIYNEYLISKRESYIFCIKLWINIIS